MIDFTNCPVDLPWILKRDGEDGEGQIITTDAQLAYARLIIAQNGDEGYYLINPREDKEEKTRYYINYYGTVEHWPDGLFDAWENMAYDILNAGMNRRKFEIAQLDEILEEGHWNTEIDEIARTMKPLDAIKYLKNEIGHSCTLYQAKQYYDKFIKKKK